MKKWMSLALLCLLLVTLTTGCGRKDETLRMEVTSITTQSDDQYVTLNIRNNAGSTVSYGWVNSCRIKVTTDEGEFSCAPPFMGKIYEGQSSDVICLRDCPGTVQRIVVTDLRLLDRNGLPGKRMRNAVLYDADKGVVALDARFGVLRGLGTATAIAIIIAGIAVLVGSGLLVLMVVRHGGAPVSRGVFSGLSIPSSGDAHTMAHDAHMREVERQAHQAAVDFGIRSTLPVDQGGFIPPPPPPPPFM